MITNVQQDFAQPGDVTKVGTYDWDGDRWHKVSHTEFMVGHAVREIKKQYGDTVSVYRKAKSLVKFGRSSNNANSGAFTVMNLQGAEAHETYVTTNVIDSAVSSNNSDTETLVVEGHTIDANGLLTFVTQEVTLTGQTPVALGTALARCTRAYVKDGTFASPSNDLLGTVAFYDSSSSSGVTAGVPNTDSAVKLQIRAGKNQSEKAATSISQYDYWILMEAHASSGRTGGTSSNIDFDIEIRQIGGVFRQAGIEVSMRNTVNPFVECTFHPHIIIPPNSDVRMVASATVNNTPVAARIEGVLAQIVS